MFITPKKAKIYLLIAAFLLAIPTLAEFHSGYDGKLLVFTSHRGNNPFVDTVVYVSQHSLYGAHGVVINKPLAGKNRELPKGIPENFGPVDYGGPVRGDNPEHNFHVLVRQDDHSVILVSLEKLLDNKPDFFEKADPEKVRLVYGYAGWFGTQLDVEVARGHWRVTEYDPDLVFTDDSQSEIYKEALKKVSKTSGNPGDQAF